MFMHTQSADAVSGTTSATRPVRADSNLHDAIQSPDRPRPESAKRMAVVLTNNPRMVDRDYAQWPDINPAIVSQVEGPSLDSLRIAWISSKRS